MPMTRPWMDELNPMQRSAVTHDGGPILVIAGAGTGKTKTLACRVAWLIEQGTAPDRILLLTFTRRAASEMIRRAQRLTRSDISAQIWAGTFHAVSNRLLRRYGRAIGLEPDFTVMDQADAEDLINLIRGDLELGDTTRRFPRKQTLLAIYSRAVNGSVKLRPILEDHFPWCEANVDDIRRVFEEYAKRKQEQHLLDYDDLLLYWKALCPSPGIGDTVAELFEHVLVDEYQDTNLMQAQILQAMGCHHRQVMVVGDDAQSIYSFRAATVHNILEFPNQFPGTQLIKLEQNYRSTQPILDASNAVMAEAQRQYAKNLFSDRHGQQKPSLITCFDEADQCNAVCQRVLEQLEEGNELRKQAVLFRAGHHSDLLEVELARRNIPFVKYGGLKFVEAAHVKDMLAVLRLMENPYDQLSWYRVLQLLDGIGPVVARKIINALGAASTIDLDISPAAAKNPLHKLVHDRIAVPQSASDAFASLADAVADCIGRRTVSSPHAELPPTSQIERIRLFYEPIFDRLYENAQVRLRDLDQLEQIATAYKTRSQFITDLTLDPPTSTQDLAGPPLLEEDYLNLSTIHSAKGCEWQVVHIIHAADGIIPSDMATGDDEQIEEERRLLYVAMTRARDLLNLYFPLRYYHRSRGFSNRHSYAQLTRFISDSVLNLFDREATESIPKPDEAINTTDVSAATSINAMLDDLWSD